MGLLHCRICDKEMYVKPSHIKKGWGKYCSKKCQSESQFKGKLVSCSICNKEIYRSLGSLKKSKSNKYFCSRSCQTIWRNNIFSGDKSANWQDGRSVYRTILLNSKISQKCVLCDQSDIRVLSVHHKDHDRTNNKLENLVWLCLNCHYLVHHSGEIDKNMRKYKL